MKATEYILEFSKLERGAEARKRGYEGDGTLIAWEPEIDKAMMESEVIEQSNYLAPSVAVVSWKGYGENPGSRYSGLYSYYSAHTSVFVFERFNSWGAPIYNELIEWQNRVRKEEVQ